MELRIHERASKQVIGRYRLPLESWTGPTRSGSEPGVRGLPHAVSCGSIAVALRPEPRSLPTLCPLRESDALISRPGSGLSRFFYALVRAFWSNS